MPLQKSNITSIEYEIGKILVFIIQISFLKSFLRSSPKIIPLERNILNRKLRVKIKHIIKAIVAIKSFKKKPYFLFRIL
tara:strand:+ start:555 stop:791 length:237 start_codon:yes stop_codon:yes gene_type:complete